MVIDRSLVDSTLLTAERKISNLPAGTEQLIQLIYIIIHIYIYIYKNPTEHVLLIVQIIPDIPGIRSISLYILLADRTCAVPT